MPLTRVVYIEAADFREDKPKGYYGFCPQQPIMLKCGLAPRPHAGAEGAAWAPEQAAARRALACAQGSSLGRSLWRLRPHFWHLLGCQCSAEISARPQIHRRHRHLQGHHALR